MCVWELVCVPAGRCEPVDVDLRLNSDFWRKKTAPLSQGLSGASEAVGAPFFSPGGGDHDDGPRVDQLRVEERAPAAAVQVGALDHVGVGVHPEHQSALHVHGQTLGADQICTAGEGRDGKREGSMEFSGFGDVSGWAAMAAGGRLVHLC